MKDQLIPDTCGEECHNHDRRTFNTLMLGAGIAAATASAAGAASAAVTETDVTIKTPDGTCDAVLTHPAGAAPGVLVWPDAGGLRPVFRDMARRLAAEGFAVLTVNPFYRVIKAPVPADMPQADRPKLREGLNQVGAAERDATAFVAFLDTRGEVRKSSKMGVTGYCMGGPLTMRTSATLPDRFGAAVSFHGGGLVTDQPTSPHLLVPKIKARYHFAVAQNDDEKQPEAKDVLKAAFEAANNPADIEVYAGANHGWCVASSQVYNEAQAERAWAKMVALFKGTLTA